MSCVVLRANKNFRKYPIAFLYPRFPSRSRNDSRYDRVQYECVRCIRAIMNNTVGLKQMFGQKEALTIVARSLDPNKPTVMLEAVKVLAAVCLIPPDGHDKVIKAITMSGELKGK